MTVGCPDQDPISQILRLRVLVEAAPTRPSQRLGRDAPPSGVMLERAARIGRFTPFGLRVGTVKGLHRLDVTQRAPALLRRIPYSVQHLVRLAAVE